MKPVFNYLNYHEYLKDFYEAKKSESSFFSYRYMGNKLGLDAGFLVKVLQGKMHLAIKAVPKVIQFCNLDEKEAEYFDILVRFGRAKTEKEVKIYFEKLLVLSGIDAHTVEKDKYAYYNKWYHSAIRSLLSYYKWNGDYPKLAKKLSPSITAKQAKESIQLLKKLGLITKNKEGYFKLANAIITSGEKWQSAAIQAFQEETIQLAKESLARHKKELRDVSTLTISVSHKDLADIQERVREFRKSILQMKTGNTESDVVYQVNIQVVPLTEIGAD